MTAVDLTTGFPALALEVAFSSGAAASGYLVFDDTARGKFDTAAFGPDQYFVDVAATDRFAKGSINRGSTRFNGPYARAEAGQGGATLDNSFREFDPTNLAGPYVAGGVSQVQPMRVFRYRATWAGVTYDLWRGFADGWDLTYSLPSVGWTELSGTDGTKVISNYDGVAGGIVGTGETTGARINRILDNIGWPSTDRVVAAGLNTVQGTDLSKNSWDELVLTADTELGELYFDAAGRVVFRDRQAILKDARSAVSQATFGDGATDLAWSAIEIANDHLQVKNIVRIARVGGTLQIVSDAASQLANQKQAWGRSDLLLQTDTEAADYAGWVLAISKNAELRPAAIEIDPTSDPTNLWPQVLGRELGDRITVAFTPPGGGARIVRPAFIRGITHTFAPGTWRTRWTLQDATQFAFLVLDDATLGALDTNMLGY